MVIDIERHSWENYLNIINYYCRGKKATFTGLNKGKKKILAKNQPFISIESYFSANEEPMLVVVMGNDTEITLGYFIKSLKKISLEKDLLSSVKKVEIHISHEKKFTLQFSSDAKKSRSVIKVYHHQISKYHG